MPNKLIAKFLGPLAQFFRILHDEKSGRAERLQDRSDTFLIAPAVGSGNMLLSREPGGFNREACLATPLSSFNTRSGVSIGSNSHTTAIAHSPPISRDFGSAAIDACPAIVAIQRPASSVVDQVWSMRR